MELENLEDKTPEELEGMLRKETLENAARFKDVLNPQRIATVIEACANPIRRGEFARSDALREGD